MNLNKAINHIILSLGLRQDTLPFKDEKGKAVPVENIVREVIVTNTIPVYSQYVPWVRECIQDMKTLKVIDKNLGIYLLPAYLTMTPVLYIIDIGLPYNVDRGTYSDIDLYLLSGMSKTVQGIAAGQAQLMLADQMRQEPSYEYLGQNKVKMFGWPRTELRFKVAAEHDPNGESIPDGCYASFLELATLDMKIFLFNNLRLYDNLNTPFGSINLRLDDYSNAVGERKEWLEKAEDTFFVDQDYAITWM